MDHVVSTREWLRAMFVLVVNFFALPPSLSKSERRKRRRAIDGPRLERRALRRMHRRNRRSRPHPGRASIRWAAGSPDQVVPIAEPRSAASVMRSLRRRLRRRRPGSSGMVEVQLNRYTGDWEVLHLSASPLSIHTSKKRAMSAARSYLRKQGTGKGTIVVLSHTGKVTKKVRVEQTRGTAGAHPRVETGRGSGRRRGAACDLDRGRRKARRPVAA